MTGADGAAVMTFVADAAGPGMIRAEVVGSSVPTAYSVFTVVPLAPLAGDSDGDSDVDLADFAVFQDCFTGDGSRVTGPACEACDIDGDDRVDLDDFAEVEATLTGPR